MKQNEAPGFIKVKQGFIQRHNFHPAQVLVGGFLLLIFLGTLFLSLPISTKSGEATPFLDALFTTTSAVCVTGLTVVNTAMHWNAFGKIVILFCIQIGGLGFMTLVSMLFVISGKKITLKNRLIMQEALNFDTTAGIVRFTMHIVKGTLLVEGIGAVLLGFVFIPEYGIFRGGTYSVFHSISAFCNAGFDLIGASSLTPYVGSGMINLVIMALIIVGGLGFSVWIDTYKMIRSKLKAPKHFKWKQAISKLSVHTKLVWILSIGLLIIGFMMIFILEYGNPGTLGALTLKEKVYAAMFQSVSPRTAGFNTIPLGSMTDTSKLLTIVLMFIGGSPAGTAGGIKTVTLGVLVLCAISTIKGNEHTTIFKRRIPFQIITRALTIIMISVVVVFTVVGILSLSEHFTFMEILFETVSAFATVGTTLGITPLLSITGKITIIIVMFIGRLGPITMGMALMVRQGKNKGNIQYPEEKVMVG